MDACSSVRPSVRPCCFNLVFLPVKCQCMVACLSHSLHVYIECLHNLSCSLASLFACFWISLCLSVRLRVSLSFCMFVSKFVDLSFLLSIFWSDCQLICLSGYSDLLLLVVVPSIGTIPHNHPTSYRPSYVHKFYVHAFLHTQSHTHTHTRA